MVALISELHKKKMYRKETLFFALGLLDRYLSRLVKTEAEKRSLDLVLLAAVCLLMAAKLNQPLSPSFYQMIRLLDEEYQEDPNCKQKMIDLEFSIVQYLQFDLQIQTPLMFIGRFLMFFAIDEVSESSM
jgi:Cyclin, N-terminal domain